MRWHSLAGLAVLLLAGCTFDQYPDPNVSEAGDIASASVLRRNFEAVHWNLERRIAAGEITRDQKDAYIKKYADQTLSGISLDKIPHLEAWAYADVMRQADRWQDAYTLLQTAVKYAPSDDRRVNDGLQLGRCAAHLGKVDEAIADARATFYVAPRGKAPILYAVLYEIVPEALGKGKDIELAQLLEDAIDQYQQTVVDPNSDSGKTFLMARSHHLQVAWDKVMQIYTQADRPDLARAALAKHDLSFSKNGHV